MNADPGGASMLRRASVRFVATGIAATLTHTAIVFAVACLFSLKAGIANFVAFIVATLLSYTLNSLWSFRSRMTRQNAVRFATVAAFCSVLAAFLADFVERAGYGLLVGICVVVLVNTPISFLLHRNWTYRTH